MSSSAMPDTFALLRETRNIPIVFVGVSDPLGSGFVASIARPGGNATGFTNFEPSLTGKWLELLKEIAPGIERAAVIFNPKTAPGEGSFFLGPFESLARSLKVEPMAARVSDPAEIESAVTAIGREPGGGLIVMPDAFTTVHRQLIILLAARYAFPRSILTATKPSMAGCCRMVSTPSICCVARHPMSIASSGARNRLIFPYRHRSSSSSSLICGPQRCSGSRCRRPCLHAPTRSSNDGMDASRGRVLSRLVV
jgi:hypothetical protein